MRSRAMATDALSVINGFASRRRIFVHYLFVVGACLVNQAFSPRRLSFRHPAPRIFCRRQILGQIVDDLFELLVRALGASADHIGDDGSPLLAGHSSPENDLLRMTRRAYSLNSFSPRPFGQLRARLLSRGAAECEAS